MNTNAILTWADDMVAQDCYTGIKNLDEFSGLEVSCEDDTITIYGDSEQIKSLIEQIIETYGPEYGEPDVQIYDDPDENIMDYPTSYENDDFENPTWKENTMSKLSVRQAKKLLESNGYTVRRPIDEEFDYDSASPEDQVRYDNAVSNLVSHGAARPNFASTTSGEWDDDGFATEFKQKTRFLRTAINDDFKHDMNQKYGYPPQELVQIASQMFDEYFEAIGGGTPNPDEFREYVEENLP